MRSYAYQDGKGTLDAVMKARDYVEAGCRFVAEIDIKDFFDSVPLDAMTEILRSRISDEAVLSLLKKYLYCKINVEDRIIEKTIGLVQGNSISPILSNMYLHPLDAYMEERDYCWLRFADNIYVYARNQEEAARCYTDVCEKIKTEFRLNVNQKKSGVHDVFVKPILGYDLYLSKGKVDVRRHRYQPVNAYHNWHDCVIQKIDQEYHIIQDGILNKKDYALLFENDKERHHIPVEVVDQLNIYGEISISGSVLRTLGEKHIKVSFFDKHGDLMGNYLPEGHSRNAAVLLEQCGHYNDTVRRLQTAKQMEIAGLHNMRANLRYYHKKKGNVLDESISQLTQYIVKINEGKDVDSLMLIEARARQKYYMAFNVILENTDFSFSQRTKRPPKDELNAMISFGNTILYNQFLRMIWKTSLNPQIGVIHAANRRNYSLNLDFADIFKPIIVDRIIFSLLNCHQIKKHDHFENKENGGVYFNEAGKRIFLEEFEKKLNTQVAVKGKSLTYRQLMQEEVMRFQKHILSGEKYKPYKYY